MDSVFLIYDQDGYVLAVRRTLDAARSYAKTVNEPVGDIHEWDLSGREDERNWLKAHSQYTQAEKLAIAFNAINLS